jgi:hypothetical protein
MFKNTPKIFYFSSRLTHMNDDGLTGRHIKMWRHVGLNKRIKYSEKLAASIFRVEDFKNLVNVSIAITAHAT